MNCNFINLSTSKMLIILLFLIPCLKVHGHFTFLSENKDIFRNAPQIIRSRGFIVETHRVVTTDGYILAIHRIVNPFCKGKTRQRPVFLQHGLMGSSSYFMLNTPGQLTADGVYVENQGIATDCSGVSANRVGTTIPFVLSACGFDVWLGNSRGNRYSDKHLVYDSTDSRYWHFNVYKLAQFDVKAMIEYVMNYTNHQDGVMYIGHSLATEFMFRLMSTNPEYNTIIRPFIAMGALSQNMLNGTSDITPGPVYGLPPQLWKYVSESNGLRCTIPGYTIDCMLYFFNFGGYDYYNNKLTYYPSRTAHYPDVTSNVLDFDNPWYDLGRVTSTSIILMSGLNDQSTTIQVTNRVRQMLRVKLYEDYIVPFTNFTHWDFVFGLNAGKLITWKILTLLYKF